MPREELDQNAADFRAGNHTVLITTDGRFRGIDMPEVSHVINFDFPIKPEIYAQCTSRFGLPGCKTVVVNFVTDRQTEALRDIEQHYNLQIVPYLPTLPSRPTEPTMDRKKAPPSRPHRSTISDLDADVSKITFDSSEEVEVLSAFDERFLKAELLRGIQAYGFETPIPIQQRALLPILSGRNIIIQAEPGMGKTSTIAIAILQRIDDDLREVQALVLSPTRELATRAQSVIAALADYSDIECHACVGGTPVREDLKALEHGVHVVSGTPERVFDMIKRRKLLVQNIKMMVIEEADEMLRKGFREQIYDIYRYLLPATQVVFISIELPDSLLKMTAKLMKNPIRMLFERDESTLTGIQQYFVTVEEGQLKFESLCNLFKTLTIGRAVIFCDTKRQVGVPKLEERRRG
ncbi:Eukaryotic initiation factor 4A-III [Tulasnella sp. 417]|nr:Eukaryotic initiation factor 4A-III [Tulasnella sp. 417]